MPAEILDMIFGFADSDDEHALARVCRAWHAVMVNRFCSRNKLGHCHSMVGTRNGGKAARARMWRTNVSAYCNSPQRLEYAINILDLPADTRDERNAIRRGGAFRGCEGVFLAPEVSSDTRSARAEIAYYLAAGGHLEKLQAWMAVYETIIPMSVLTDAAARFCRLGILSYLAARGRLDKPRALVVAGDTGNIKLFDYLVTILRVECTGDVMEPAARSGHLAFLKMCHERHVPIRSICLRTAAYNSRNLDLVRYVLDITDLSNNFYECYHAAFAGTGPILKLLRERGCPWTKDVTTVAAEHGNLSALQYAVEQGCPCDRFVGRSAVRRLHFECAEYLYSRGFDVQVNPMHVFLTGSARERALKVKRIVVFLEKHPPVAQKDIGGLGE